MQAEAGVQSWDGLAFMTFTNRAVDARASSSLLYF